MYECQCLFSQLMWAHKLAVLEEITKEKSSSHHNNVKHISLQENTRNCLNIFERVVFLYHKPPCSAPILARKIINAFPVHYTSIYSINQIIFVAVLEKNWWTWIRIHLFPTTFTSIARELWVFLQNGWFTEAYEWVGQRKLENLQVPRFRGCNFTTQIHGEHSASGKIPRWFGGNMFVGGVWWHILTESQPVHVVSCYATLHSDRYVRMIDELEVMIVSLGLRLRVEVSYSFRST